MRNQVSRILTMQRKNRELGRIRLGQYVSTGKGRPAKLDKFRFTSQSRELLEKVAALYGGEVREWTPQGSKTPAYEVLSDSRRVPILLPPQAVSQAYELWSGGGCVRRCDGEREVISDQPCMCDPDPTLRKCAPTTRLNVVLKDVEGIGVWRLETHGYYAAVELPAVAEFLGGAQGGSYLPAYLILEQRVSKTDGKTKEFMVPGIEIEGVTPAALMAGAGLGAIEAADPPAAALEAAPAQLDMDSFLAAVRAAGDMDELRELWRMAHAEKLGTVAFDALNAAVEKLNAAAGHVVDDRNVVEPDDQASRAEVDSLWQTVLLTVPEDTPTSQVEADFASVTGTSVEHAGVDDMTRYLEHLAG